MEEGEAWENSRCAALQNGRWCYLQIVFRYFTLHYTLFLMVMAFLIQAAIIINSQKKVKNVDLTLQNKLYISDECMKSFGGYHSSFKVSSVIIINFFRQYSVFFLVNWNKSDFFNKQLNLTLKTL